MVNNGQHGDMGWLEDSWGTWAIGLPLSVTVDTRLREPLPLLIPSFSPALRCLSTNIFVPTDKKGNTPEMLVLTCREYFSLQSHQSLGMPINPFADPGAHTHITAPNPPSSRYRQIPICLSQPDGNCVPARDAKITAASRRHGRETALPNTPGQSPDGPLLHLEPTSRNKFVNQITTRQPP